MGAFKKLAEFTTKKSAHSYFKALLNNNRIGTRFQQGSEEFEKLHELLQRHEQYEEKIGAGLLEFTILKTEVGTRCFAVRRVDLSVIDFSYIHCLAPIKADGFSQACRSAIAGEMLDVRNTLLSLGHGCAHCGESDWQTLTLDHKQPSFRALVVDFIKQLDSDVPLTFSGETVVSFRPEERFLEEKWVAFHHERATYQVLCRGCNSRKGQKGG